MTDPAPSLLGRIAAFPDILDQLPSEKEFVLLVADVFAKQGYTVQVKQVGKSTKGVDVLARPVDSPNRITAIKCKYRHPNEQPVSLGVIKELTKSMVKSHSDEGIIVTNSYFTKEVRQYLANTAQLRGVDRDELLLLIKDVIARDSRLPSHYESTLQNPEPQWPSFQFLMDPGSATPEEIADFFFEISKLYRLIGGHGIDFRVTESREPSFSESSQ